MSKLRRRLGLAALFVLLVMIFCLYWPAAWWNPYVAAVELRGGEVISLSNPQMAGRLAVRLPPTTTDENLESMTSLDRLRPVCVQLQGGPVTNRGLASLRRLGELRGLSLLGTKVDDEGMKHLEVFEHLEILNLDGCAITDRGLQDLKKLPRLQVLSLFGTQVTRDGIDRLRKARPRLKVTSVYTMDDD
jgi:hypothetical protein